MAAYCPNCGSAVALGAHFCPDCGFAVAGATTPALSTGPEVAPPGSPGQTFTGSPASASGAAPTVFAPPGPHRTDPPPPGHGIPAIVVAIAGAVAVGAGIAALVVFLSGGHGSSLARARPPAAPSPSQPSVPPPPPTPSPSAGTQGNLASAFPNSVGSFTLDQGSLQQDPTLISDGATDSLEGTYSDSNGNQVLADLGAFGNPSRARNEVVVVARNFSRRGFSVASPQPLADNRGTQIGIFVTADGSTISQPDHVIESSNNLYEEFVGSDFSTLAEFSRTFP